MRKPSAEEALAAYKRINSGYRRKAVFQLTSARGFSNNVANVIVIMLYCLVHKLQFQLGCSNFWLPGKKADQGGGLFVPFCSESNFQPPHAQSIGVYSQKYTLSWNMHHPFVLNLNFALDSGSYIASGVRGKRGKLFSSLKWLIMSLWCRQNRKKREELYSRHFFFPQLGIDGDIFHAKSVIAKMILQPVTKVADEHRKAVENLKPYIAVHVRRGDKFLEIKRITEVSKYLKKIRSVALDTKNIFVATDDYRVVSEFQKLCPDMNIVTFCDKEKEGYSQKEFRKNPHKEEELMKFLTDLYYLENADHFVGTYSSSVSRITALLRGRETCHSLDFKWYPG